MMGPVDAVANLPALAAEVLRLTPSAWARAVRYLRVRETGELRPYSFDRRPFLLDPHDEARNVVVMKKGSQIGATELALNRGAHCICALNDDVLTVLPQREQIKTFVQARVDGMFDASPALRALPMKASNPEHKRIGSANWYFRGSNSVETIVEFPARLVILDELDRLNPEAIPLALERLTGIRQDLRMVYKISTPTYAGRAIDSAYANSTRSRWFVRCPHCTDRHALSWGPQGNLDAVADYTRIPEAAWRCRKCGSTWTEAERLGAILAGSWEDENPGHHVRGFALSQLYSPNETAASIILKYLDAVNSDDAPTRLRVFWNSVLGESWAAEGEQLTDAAIDRARAGDDRYGMRSHSPSGALVSAGADVGRDRIHVSVSEWPAVAGDAVSRLRRVVALYVVTDWADLDRIIDDHGVSCLVVDATPETRNARELQSRNPDRVWLAWYPESAKELVRWEGMKADSKSATGLSGGRVLIHRTEAFDRLFGRFQAPLTIRLPADLPEEARAHLRAPAVVRTVDRWGQEVRRWDSAGRADHFAHAMLYDEIAGLQVGALGPTEIPQDRGAARELLPEVLSVGAVSVDEWDRFGGLVTGVF